MGSVWKRLQRVNKRAAKFQFTSSYHELRLETTAKWRPSNLSVVWTRRSRRVASAPLAWEPDMMNPLVGLISWPVPDNHAISVTLFKDPRTHELEDKDWTFVIEDITPMGKKRVLASASINMRKYASIESTQQSFTLNLKPVSRKITSADLELTISCVFLREGKATDEDMQSVVSLMSVNNNCDVAPLDDLEDIPDLESSGEISDHLFDFTQQLEQMTSSLNGCIDLPTPMSVPSLSEDPTPLAEVNRFNFELELDKQPTASTAAASADDELLKTPSATTTHQAQQHQQQATAASSVGDTTTKVPTDSAKQATTKTSSSATSTSLSSSPPPTTTTANKQSDAIKTFGSNLSKIVTSTPIAKKLPPVEKQPETTATAAASSGARKGIDFKDSLSLETTTTVVDKTKTASNNISLASITTTNTTIKESAAIKAPAAASTAEKLNKTTTALPTTTTKTTPLLTTTDEHNKTLPSTTTTMNNHMQQQQQRSELKRAELQPLNLKKSYEHDNNTHCSSNIVNKTNIISNGNNSSLLSVNSTALSNSNSGGTVNTNNTNNSSSKPVERIILKENTPGQDLLEWCKDVTKDYPNVKVTNLTTSWRNGMAFCAIIHHFEPTLVDMTKLSAHDVVNNCRTAFDAAESLGIPRVIEPRDMSLLAVPDKLAVMTYLHQLRAHFTGKQLQIEQIGTTSDESSYVIGNYKSDNLSQNLLNLTHIKAQLLHQNSLDDDIFGLDKSQSQSQLSPTAKKDVKNLILSGSKSILGKVLSPAKDKNSINASQHSNLAGLANNTTIDSQRNSVGGVSIGSGSVGSNDDDGALVIMDDELLECDERKLKLFNSNNQENTSNNQQLPTPGSIDANTANKILLRHKEMSEKAKIMREKLKISNGNEQDDERQQRLREQARRLILETRTKSINGGLDSPTSPTRLKRMNFSPERTISPIHNGIGDDPASPTKLSPTKKITPPRDIEASTPLNNHKLSPSHRLSERFNGGSSPLQSFSAVMDRISPKGDKKGDKLSYIESELEALEREQEAIDQKASNLEKKLRAVMGGNPKSEETEEQLLSQWFTLVNKKNALLRRQMQLNILEQESDLERKYTMLNQELRAAQSVEDWRKTEAQREKERLLLEELVCIVDKRDQLVQRLHNEEIAIEDDQEIARELEQVDISGGKEKCCIQ